MVRSGKEQLRASLKKTLTVRRRKPAQLACDFVFPVLMVGLVYAYTFAPPSKVKVFDAVEVPQKYEVFPTPMQLLNCTKAQGDEQQRQCSAWSWAMDLFTGAAPKGSPKVLAFINSTNTENDLVQSILNTESDLCEGSYCPDNKMFCALACPELRFFENQEDLENDFKEDSKNYWAAIIPDKEDGETVVKIRMSNKNVPSTNADDRSLSLSKFAKPTEKFDPDKPSTYLTSGFLALQLLIHKAVAGSDQVLTHVQQFPHAKMDRDGDFAIFGSYLLMMFLPFAINLSREMLVEKEKKIKEAMSIMGMKDWVFWANWTIIGSLYGLIISAILIGIGAVVCFTNAPIGYVILSSILFLYTVLAMCFFVYALCDKARTGAILMLVLLYAPNVIYSAVKPSVASAGPLIGLSILPAACFIEAMAQLAAGFDSISDDANEPGYPFSTVLTMQVIDFFLYFILAWYIDKVMPGEYGIPRKWYFPVQPSYWFPSRRSNSHELSRTRSLSDPTGDMEANLLDDHQLDPSSIEKVPESVACRDGVRISRLRKVYRKHAMRDSPEDKVAVQRVSMEMYSGQIFALLGHNGAGKSTTISMLVGLVPPTEGQCEIFGKTTESDLDAVRDMVGYCPQHDVLFDELTVAEHLELFAIIKGVDPESVAQEVNRRLEECGIEEKRDTRIGALSGGMKRKLSVAISFIGDSKLIVLDEPTAGMDPVSRRAVWDLLQASRGDRVILLTTHFMDEADLLGDRICIMAKGLVKCIGTSLFLKNKFGLGYYLTLVKDKRHNKTDEVTSLLRQYVPAASLASDSAAELAYRLPLDSVTNFGRMMKELDRKLSELELVQYGLSVTTLEEVFLRIADEEVDDLASLPPVEVQNAKLRRESSSFGQHFTNAEDSTIWRQTKALLVKKGIHSRRRLGDTLCALLTPIFALLLGCIFAKTLTQVLPGEDDISFLNFQDSLGLDSPLHLNAYISDASVIPALEAENVTVTQLPSLADVNKVLFNLSQVSSSHTVDLILQTAGALDLQKDMTRDDLVISNQRLYHSLPAMANLLSNAQYEESVQFHSYPLSPPASLVPSTQIVLFLLALGMWFLPSVFAYTLVQDRQNNTKHQLKLMGTDMRAYWLAAFIGDYIISIIVGVFVVILFGVFSIEQLRNGKILWIGILMILLPMSNLTFTYLLSFLIDDPNSSRGLLVVGNFILGLIPYIGTIVLGALEYYDAMKAVNYLFSLFPPYAMLAGLYNLTFISDDASISEVFSLSDIKSFVGNFPSPTISLIFVFLSFFIYAGLIYAMEQTNLGTTISRMFTNHGLGSVTELMGEDEEDDDVKEERRRLENAAPNDSDAIVINGVRKVYPAQGGNPAHIAVSDFSLAIEKGVCFGLLGPNGAGKTSLMKMLTGDVKPDTGDAHIYGSSIRNDLDSVYRKLGYCPQFDAQWGELTGREHLRLYSEIKGVPPERVNDVVQNILEKMELVRYADQQSEQYSGGNRRKLSVAIALFAEPKVTYLDEPSTGVDPSAKRAMWDLIAGTMAGRAMILTTHSMEEADALCSQLAIMVNGRMVCLGSGQHLKSKYGSGYQLQIMSSDAKGEEVHKFVTSFFKDAALADQPYGGLRLYNIPLASVNLGDAFDEIERNRKALEIEDFSLSQTSLEQVFISFAKKQVDMEG